MKRLIIISDRKRKGLVSRLLTFILESEQYEYTFPAEIHLLMDNIRPDFVLTDIKRPVSGNDLMSMVSELDELSRLRVLYIKLFIFRKPEILSKLQWLHIASQFIYRNKTVKKAS
jgi:hypothetical protein